MQLRCHDTILLLEFILLINSLVTASGYSVTRNNANADSVTDNSTKADLETGKSMKAAEFFMSKGVYEEINWYGLACETLDQVREHSERNFGNIDVCPQEIKRGNDLSENDKSNCPWYYELNHRSTRYPNNILIARTPCFSCIGYDSDYFQCLTITQNVTVFNKIEDVSGELKYEAEEIEIPVGFTCGARDFANNYVKEVATSTAPLIS